MVSTLSIHLTPIKKLEIEFTNVERDMIYSMTRLDILSTVILQLHDVISHQERLTDYGRKYLTTDCHKLSTLQKIMKACVVVDRIGTTKTVNHTPVWVVVG